MNTITEKFCIECTRPMLSPSNVEGEYCLECFAIMVSNRTLQIYLNGQSQISKTQKMVMFLLIGLFLGILTYIFLSDIGWFWKEQSRPMKSVTLQMAYKEANDCFQN